MTTLRGRSGLYLQGGASVVRPGLVCVDFGFSPQGGCTVVLCALIVCPFEKRTNQSTLYSVHLRTKQSLDLIGFIIKLNIGRIVCQPWFVCCSAKFPSAQAVKRQPDPAPIRDLMPHPVLHSLFAICGKACARARQNGVLRVTRMLLLLLSVHYGIHFPGNAA